MDKTLPAGALNCPEDLAVLHFEQVHGMRVARDGRLTARCPTCKRYYQVFSSESKTVPEEKSNFLNINACRALARRARELEHKHYIEYCEMRGIAAQGMGGHINWTRDQCLAVIQMAQRNIEAYKSACDPEDTDTEIMRLSKELGIYD
jgi:hypothetical protein